MSNCDLRGQERRRFRKRLIANTYVKMGLTTKGKPRRNKAWPNNTEKEQHRFRERERRIRFYKKGLTSTGKQRKRLWTKFPVLKYQAIGPQSETEKMYREFRNSIDMKESVTFGDHEPCLESW